MAEVFDTAAGGGGSDVREEDEKDRGAQYWLDEPGIPGERNVAFRASLWRAAKRAKWPLVALMPPIAGKTERECSYCERRLPSSRPKVRPLSHDRLALHRNRVIGTEFCVRSPYIIDGVR